MREPTVNLTAGPPAMLPASNPLATRFVQPGAIPWVPPDETATLQRLVDTFLGPLGRRAAIIGDHGSGKSTLLVHLSREIGDHQVVRIQLRRGEQPFLKAWRCLQNLPPHDILALDGWEQLPWAGRWLVRTVTALRNVGLLVTSHRPCGLPVLYHTCMTPELAWRLVVLRMQQAAVDLTTDQWNELHRHTLAAYQKHRGNLREVFMELYDHIATLK